MDFGRNRGRGRSVNSRLSVQSYHPKGSDGDTALWNEAVNRGFRTPLRDDAGVSAARSERENNGSALFDDGGGLRAGGHGSRADSERGEGEGISGLEGIDAAQFPDVPDGYWQQVKEAATGVADERVRPKTGVLDEDGSELDDLVGIALQTVRDVLSVETPDPFDDHYPKILAIKKDAAISIIGAGLKADENRFRKRNTDVLSKLFEALKQERSDPEGPLLEARLVP